MLNINIIDPNKIKIEKRSCKKYSYLLHGFCILSYKNILIYYIALYLITNKIIVYTEESNENKYLRLVPTDGSKDTLKNNEELWSKIKDIIKSTIKLNNSDNYNKNIYIKVKFNSDDDLPDENTRI